MRVLELQAIYGLYLGGLISLHDKRFSILPPPLY